MTKRIRLFILLLAVAIGCSFLYPSFNWYFLLDQETRDLASETREAIRTYARTEAETLVKNLKDAVVADPNAAIPDNYNFVIKIAKSEYKEQKKDLPKEWKAKDLLEAFSSASAMVKAVEAKYRNDILAIKNQKSRIVQLGLDLAGGMSVVLDANPDRMTEKLGRSPTQDEYSEAIDLAIEVLKGRIDAFGISEPSVRKDEGANRLYIEIPGDNDPERVNNFLMGGGDLTLQIVDSEADTKFQQFLAQYQQENVSSWTPDIALPEDVIPVGDIVLPTKEKDEYGIDYTTGYLVLKNGAEFKVDGSYITEAQVTQDQLTGVPNVNFVMNSEGAEKFRILTRDNVNKPMAIILDGSVRAHPNISEEIPSGQVRISGFNAEEASSISKVLKTGALPIDFKIDSQQAVGASLGEDAIKSGATAIAVGFIAVMIFMLIYYLGAGIYADIALLLNLFFMLAILSVFNLTLTLTSIAGLVLTIGMAVDANVIIFERIKDELRDGKSRAAAVTAGYSKAFWTIADANITTIIASILLAYLGTGPIQGFAVTLTVGVLTSMFTALFVTRLFQDFGTEQLKHSKMSIAWRLSK